MRSVSTDGSALEWYSSRLWAVSAAVESSADANYELLSVSSYWKQLSSSLMNDVYSCIAYAPVLMASGHNFNVVSQQLFLAFGVLSMMTMFDSPIEPRSQPRDSIKP